MVDDGETYDVDAQRIRMIREEYAQRRSLYEEWSECARLLLLLLAGEGEIKTNSVTARAKDQASLMEKLQRKAHYTKLTDLPDLSGVRAVTYNVSDSALLRQLVAEFFDVLEEVRHGIDAPEQFGYSGTHLVVALDKKHAELPEFMRFRGLKAELQVRTVLQDAWATVSHRVDYKFSDQAWQTFDSRRRLFRVAALLEAADETLERIQSEAIAHATTDWRSLPVRSDVLYSAWPMFPKRRVIEAGRDAGLSPSLASYMVEPASSAVFDNLCLASEKAEVKTLGGLVKTIDKAEADGRLRWIVEKASKAPMSGFDRHLNVAGILTLAVLSFSYVDSPEMEYPYLGPAFISAIGGYLWTHLPK
jgi:ppGpp synthetase/RelA/SpoT-type nucleotidyltranferase